MSAMSECRPGFRTFRKRPFAAPRRTEAEAIRVTKEAELRRIISMLGDMPRSFAMAVYATMNIAGPVTFSTINAFMKESFGREQVFMANIYTQLEVLATAGALAKRTERKDPGRHVIRDITVYEIADRRLLETLMPVASAYVEAEKHHDFTKSAGDIQNFSEGLAVYAFLGLDGSSPHGPMTFEDVMEVAMRLGVADRVRSMSSRLHHLKRKGVLMEAGKKGRPRSYEISPGLSEGKRQELASAAIAYVEREKAIKEAILGM